MVNNWYQTIKSGFKSHHEHIDAIASGKKWLKNCFGFLSEYFTYASCGEYMK